jgi:hypothetical protein
MIHRSAAFAAFNLTHRFPRGVATIATLDAKQGVSRVRFAPAVIGFVACALAAACEAGQLSGPACAKPTKAERVARVPAPTDDFL